MAQELRTLTVLIEDLVSDWVSTLHLTIVCNSTSGEIGHPLLTFTGITWAGCIYILECSYTRNKKVWYLNFQKRRKNQNCTTEDLAILLLYHYRFDRIVTFCCFGAANTED